MKFNDVIMVYEAVNKPFSIDQVPDLPGKAQIRNTDGVIEDVDVTSFRTAAAKAIEDYKKNNEKDYKGCNIRKFDMSMGSTKESKIYRVFAELYPTSAPSLNIKSTVAKLIVKTGNIAIDNRPKPVNKTLKIGKYTLFFDLPAYVYTFEDAVKQKVFQSTTLKNVNMFIENGYHPLKVYRVDRSQGRNALSTYVEMEKDNKPYVYARIETSNRQAGQTILYTEKTKGKAHDFEISRKKVGGTIKLVTIAGTNFYRDDMQTLHNVYGPAWISNDGSENGYFVNGKKYTKEQFDDLFRNVTMDQREDLANMMEGYD